MERVKPIPEGLSAVTPSLVVQGGKDAIEFYKNAFGAKVKRIFYEIRKQYFMLNWKYEDRY